MNSGRVGRGAHSSSPRTASGLAFTPGPTSAPAHAPREPPSPAPRLPASAGSRRPDPRRLSPRPCARSPVPPRARPDPPRRPAAQEPQASRATRLDGPEHLYIPRQNLLRIPPSSPPARGREPEEPGRSIGLRASAARGRPRHDMYAETHSTGCTSRHSEASLVNIPSGSATPLAPEQVEARHLWDSPVSGERSATPTATTTTVRLVQVVLTDVDCDYSRSFGSQNCFRSAWCKDTGAMARSRSGTHHVPRVVRSRTQGHPSAGGLERVCRSASGGPRGRRPSTRVAGLPRRVGAQRVGGGHRR